MKNVFLAIVSLLVSLTGCKKDDFIGPEIIDDAIAEEVTAANHYYSQIYQIVSSEVELLSIEASGDLMPDSIQASIADPCANIIYHMDESETYVSDLIIFYEDTTCYSSGVQKKGVLRVHLTGPIEYVGTEMIIIPENFSINGDRIEGTINVESLGFTSVFQLAFSEKIIDGKITLNNYQDFTWNSNSTIRIDIVTNQFIYNSNARGLSRTGREYKTQTLFPLKRTVDCKYFQEGGLKLNSNWGLDQNLNYGNGDCDNESDLWQNGSFKLLELP